MIIGICGYGFTGTGAVFSLLKEYSRIRCLPGKRDDIEFTISYMPDGLEDLEYHLCRNFVKGISSDTAIYRFQLLVRDLERSHNRFTQNRFKRLSYDYLDSLIQVRWQGIRTFEYDRNRAALIRYSRLLRSYLSTRLKRCGFNAALFPFHERYLSVEPKDFQHKTKQYMAKLLGPIPPGEALLLNQPFSTNNPQHSMRFFEDPRCIIVDRDPRDLYIMAKYVYGPSAMFIPTDSVENFITYFVNVRKSLQTHDSRILPVRFEDLVFCYEETVSSIEDFLGLSPDQHQNRKRHFQPEDSIQNTNIFGKYAQEEAAIKKIEQELAEWLYPFQKSAGSGDGKNLARFTFM